MRVRVQMRARVCVRVCVKVEGEGEGGLAGRTLLGLLVVERLVAEGRGVQHGVVGVHLAAGLEQHVPRHDVALDHALVDQSDA